MPRPAWFLSRRIAALCAVTAVLGACALVGVDRSVGSTMTLAPGQRATARFAALHRGTASVLITRWPPQFAGPDAPVPGAVTWRGDDRIRIRLPDDPKSVEEPLGYTSFVVSDSSAFRVVVRNAAAGPVAFRWTVSGVSDVAADWDFGGSESAE